jgi:hypothetical protein
MGQISARLLLLLFEELLLPITLQCVSKMIVNLVEEVRFFQSSFFDPWRGNNLKIIKRK